MIVVENITIYKCEHCRKKYEIKRHCEAHELRCMKNPENFIRCTDCKFISEKELEYYVDNELTEEYIKIKAFWCSKKEHWLYPYHKCNNPISQDNIIDEVDNEPMPKDCDMYKYKFE